MFTFYPHFASVHFYDLSHNGKPESRAGFAPGGTCTELFEAFEYLLEIFFAQSLAGVFDVSDNFGKVQLAKHSHLTARKRIFDGITQQIVDHLRDPRFIDHHRRKRAVLFHDQPDILLRSRARVEFFRFFQNNVQILTVQIEIYFTRFNCGVPTRVQP